MNPPPESLSTKDVTPSREIRGPELGSARKRDQILRRVLAARKRLAPRPSN